MLKGNNYGIARLLFPLVFICEPYRKTLFIPILLGDQPSHENIWETIFEESMNPE